MHKPNKVHDSRRTNHEFNSLLFEVEFNTILSSKKQCLHVSQYKFPVGKLLPYEKRRKRKSEKQTKELLRAA